MINVLMIEDDTEFAEILSEYLSKYNIKVTNYEDPYLGLSAGEKKYDLLILDLTLPGMDGRDILREWREKGQREPVLILTARDALAERVEGLRLGADDYLCKPFALIEVAARLEALMRRTNGQASNELRHGNVMLDPGKRIATLAGEPLTLKPKEFALLELLLRNAGRVLPRKLIEEKLYTWDEEVTSNAVEVHVHHLRRKLGSDFIRTVHGIGYTLGEK